MKYNLFFIILLLFSCNANLSQSNNKVPYNSKGFAYIYDEQDYNNKITKLRLDNSKIQVSHNKIKKNSLIKIINPRSNEYLVVKNHKKTNYSDFYKIVITKKVAEKLKINPELPLVEIIEIKKNKSFVAKKAKIFNEEKKISTNVPVASVKISNILTNEEKKIKKKEKIYILIGSFYSQETARFLKKRIKNELPSYDLKKLIIKRISKKEINLISGPYNSVNLMKNDYIKLKKFGFEELDITINE